MIETRELRIGNIILFHGEPVEVMGIHTGSVLLDGVMRPSANGIGIEYNPISAQEDTLEPLPLNDFLLETMGMGRFKSYSGVTQHQYHPGGSIYSIMFDEEGYFIGMEKEDGPVHITPRHFYFFHQLQNLHFSQYGEEINIDEEDVKRAWRTAKNLGKV